MSSLTRMLAVVDVFTPERPTATAEDIMLALGYSRGTAYRYIRELCAFGLLSRVAGTYTLGPKIIELDYYIRQCDPVLRVGLPIMRHLRDEIDCDVLLTSFYGDRVVVTHHEKGDGKITVSVGRGRVMPLFRGAGSKPIIAYLPPSRLKRFFAENAAEIAASGLGGSWPAFRQSLAAIRRAGYATSVGELDPANAAVGAPILMEDGEVAGSIVLVFSRTRFMIVDQKLVADIAMRAARQIEAGLRAPSGPAVFSFAAAPAEPALPVQKRRRSK